MLKLCNLLQCHQFDLILYCFLLLRTICLKGRRLSGLPKRLSGFESHTRENSERFLYDEIAGVMEIPVNRVEQFIAARIDRKEA